MRRDTRNPSNALLNCPRQTAAKIESTDKVRINKGERSFS